MKKMKLGSTTGSDALASSSQQAIEPWTISYMMSHGKYQNLESDRSKEREKENERYIKRETAKETFTFIFIFVNGP